MGFSFKTHRKELQVAGVIFGGFCVLGIAAVLGPRFAPKPDVRGSAVAKHDASEEAEGAEGDEGEGEEQASSERHGSAEAQKSLWATFREGVSAFQAKVETLHHADEENGRLKLENSYLRARLEGMRFAKSQDSANSFTTETGLKLDHETGSRIGRTLASIAYKPPGHLLPAQLHTLAVSYFKAREDEKSAVLLSFLTGLEDNETYRNPRDFLMTGIAWYRIDNFELADEYFDKVLKFTPPAAKRHARKEEDAKEDGETVAESEHAGVAEHGERAPAGTDAFASTLQYQAHARIWKGLVAKRRGQNKKAQEWFRDVIDHHPHSEEASWVNTGVARPGGGEE